MNAKPQADFPFSSRKLFQFPFVISVQTLFLNSIPAALPARASVEVSMKIHNSENREQKPGVKSPPPSAKSVSRDAQAERVQSEALGQKKILFRRLAPFICSFFLVVAVLVVMNQITRAGAAPFSPQVLAAFKGNDTLQVAVTLDPKTKSNKQGHFTLEIADNAGKVISKHEQDAALDASPVTLPVSITKKDAEKSTLRLTLDGQTWQSPLDKVLLAKGHETTVSAGQEFHFGSISAITGSVRGVRSLTETVPLKATVKVQLKSQKDNSVQDLYSGTTDANGNFSAPLTMPKLDKQDQKVDEAAYTLIVTTQSPLGEEKLESPVRLLSDAKILLVTDKPVYHLASSCTSALLCSARSTCGLSPARISLSKLKTAKGTKCLRRRCRPRITASPRSIFSWPTK